LRSISEILDARVITRNTFFTKSPLARTIAGHARINPRVPEGGRDTRKTRNEIGRYANSLSVTLTRFLGSAAYSSKKTLRPFPFSATPRHGVNGDVAPCQNVLEIVLLARPSNLGFFLANNHARQNSLELLPPRIFHEWKMKMKNWDSIWQTRVKELGNRISNRNEETTDESSRQRNYEENIHISEEVRV